MLLLASTVAPVWREAVSLARRPNAHCVIVGRDAVSYGSAPARGGSWREAMQRRQKVK